MFEGAFTEESTRELAVGKDGEIVHQLQVR